MEMDGPLVSSVKLLVVIPDCPEEPTALNISDLGPSSRPPAAGFTVTVKSKVLPVFGVGSTLILTPYLFLVTSSLFSLSMAIISSFPSFTVSFFTLIVLVIVPLNVYAPFIAFLGASVIVNSGMLLSIKNAMLFFSEPLPKESFTLILNICTPSSNSGPPLDFFRGTSQLMDLLSVSSVIKFSSCQPPSSIFQLKLYLPSAPAIGE